MNVGYEEKELALETRIKYHKLYSNFHLEDYIQNKILTRLPTRGLHVLDVGCGRGNLTKILSRNASIYIGIDKDKALLDEAYLEYKHFSNIIFIHKDMDDKYYLPENYFDLIILAYSAYYSENYEYMLGELIRLLKERRIIFFVGPGVHNAPEIDAVCKELFGNVDKKKVVRSSRLLDEFYPKLKVMPKLNVDYEIVNASLDFPSSEEFTTYFKSTLQYREAQKCSKATVTEEKIERKIKELGYKRVSKEIVLLCSQKKK